MVEMPLPIHPNSSTEPFSLRRGHVKDLAPHIWQTFHMPRHHRLKSRWMSSRNKRGRRLRCWLIFFAKILDHSVKAQERVEWKKRRAVDCPERRRINDLRELYKTRVHQVAEDVEDLLATVSSDKRSRKMVQRF